MIASVGETPEACFDAFLEKRSGNRPLVSFDASRFNVHRAFEIDDRLKGQDRKGRPSSWLARAIREAAESARLPDADRRRAPVLVGTGLRELRSVELWWTNAEPDLPAH